MSNFDRLMNAHSEDASKKAGEVRFGSGGGGGGGGNGGGGSWPNPYQPRLRMIAFEAQK